MLFCFQGSVQGPSQEDKEGRGAEEGADGEWEGRGEMSSCRDICDNTFSIIIYFSSNWLAVLIPLM